MILKLRQRHRRMFAVLAVVMPLLFAAGILARNSVPRMAAATSDPQPFDTLWQRADVFPKTRVECEFKGQHAPGGRFALSFTAPKDFSRPDPLVYWVSGDPASLERLPDNALFLGALSSPLIPVPEEAVKADGVLILFSLADNEILEVSRPIHLAAKKP